MPLHRLQISRARILDGAFALLDADPDSSLTVDGLARSLRMSKSTLYKYFTRKEEVLVAMIERACAESEAELAACPVLSAGAGPEALQALMECYAAHGDRLPKAVILRPDKLPVSSRQRLQQTRMLYEVACREVIARGANKGEFAYRRADLLATALCASIEAVLVAGAEGTLESDRGAAVRALPQLFLPGMRAA